MSTGHIDAMLRKRAEDSIDDAGIEARAFMQRLCSRLQNESGASRGLPWSELTGILLGRDVNESTKERLIDCTQREMTRDFLKRADELAEQVEELRGELDR